MAQLTPGPAGPSGTGEEKLRTDILEWIRDGLKIILADIQARLSEETDAEMQEIEIEQQLVVHGPPSPFDRIVHGLELILEALQARNHETDIGKLRIDMTSVLQYLEEVKKSPPPDSNQHPLGWIQDGLQGILKKVEEDAGKLRIDMASLLQYSESMKSPPRDLSQHPLGWIRDELENRHSLLLEILKEVKGPPPSPGGEAAFRNYSQEIEEVPSDQAPPSATTLRTAILQHVSRLETQLEVNRGQGRWWGPFEWGRQILRRRRGRHHQEEKVEEDMEHAPGRQQHPLEWIRRGLDLILEEGRDSPWNGSQLTFAICSNILTAFILGLFWMVYFLLRHQSDGCPSPCAPCPPCHRNWSSIILENEPESE